MTALPPELDYTRKPVPAEIEAGSVFTQVCGWPLQTIYAGQATVLGVPAYGVPHCDGPTHAGVFVVQRTAASLDRRPARLRVRLQQRPFELGHEPAAPGDRRTGRRQAVLRVDRRDPQPTRQPGTRRPRRSRRHMCRLRHLRLLSTPSPGLGEPASRAGRNAADAGNPFRHGNGNPSVDQGGSRGSAAACGNCSAMGISAGRD